MSILSIQFDNPITNEIDYLTLESKSISYEDWRKINCYYIDRDEITIINKIIDEQKTFCNLICNSGVHTFFYEKTFVVPLLYNLNRIQNPFDYNKALDSIIEAHKNNIIIYNNEAEIDALKPKTPPKKAKKATLKNKFYKQEQLDIFGNMKYIYLNPKTGEQFESDNPNLLESLNAKKKKPKASAVSVKAMTFNFKKK